MAEPFPGQRPKRKSSGCLVVGIIGIFSVLAILCCGGVGMLAYFGLNLVTDEVESELRDNPVIAEHIGSIQSFEMDWGASFIEEEEDNVFVFRIRGSKASGEVTVESITNDDGLEEVVWGTLEVDSGGTFDLFPEEP